MNKNEDTPEAKGKAMGQQLAYPMVETDNLGMSYNYGMTKREVIAMHVTGDLLKAMFDRRNEPGYTETGAVYEAVNLAKFTADALLEALNV